VTTGGARLEIRMEGNGAGGDISIDLELDGRDCGVVSRRAAGKQPDLVGIGLADGGDAAPLDVELAQGGVAAPQLQLMTLRWVAELVPSVQTMLEISTSAAAVVKVAVATSESWPLAVTPWMVMVYVVLGVR